MRRRLLQCALPILLFLSGCATAATAESAPAVTASNEPHAALLRMTLVPADIDRALRFYREVLGYEVSFDGDIARRVNRQLLGLAEGETVRFIVLKGAAEIGGKKVDAAGIGLMAIGGRPTLPVLAQPSSNTFASGQAMMAVVTDDIDAVIARVRAFGAPMLVGPVEAETARGREREIVILDPDNTRIHVVQMLAPEAPR